MQYIVIHATHNTEGPTSAEAGAAYDKRRTDGTSTHLFVDSDSAVREVHDTDRAHHARYHGNEIGIGVEICGRADQTPAQWADPISTATLRIAAVEVARLCRAHGIPPRRLSVAQVRAAYYAAPADRPKGICSHGDVTAAYPEDLGDHTDPGPGFPWPAFLDAVTAELGGTMPLTQADIDAVARAVVTYPLASPSLGRSVPLGDWLKDAEVVRRLLLAQAAEDATRDAAVLAAVEALANAGGVDSAPVVAAIQAAAADTRGYVRELQVTIEDLRAQLADRDARLAAALAPATVPGATQG